MTGKLRPRSHETGGREELSRHDDQLASSFFECVVRVGFPGLLVRRAVGVRRNKCQSRKITAHGIAPTMPYSGTFSYGSSSAWGASASRVSAEATIPTLVRSLPSVPVQVRTWTGTDGKERTSVGIVASALTLLADAPQAEEDPYENVPF